MTGGHSQVLLKPHVCRGCFSEGGLVILTSRGRPVWDSSVRLSL